jgi:hypothetical protein
MTGAVQGVPHGDVKLANLLYVGGVFALTDLPALNWTATPVLTKDPVAHSLRRDITDVATPSGEASPM